MKRGILLYQHADAARNKGFIDRLTEKGKRYALDIRLHVMEEIQNEKGLEKLLAAEKPDVALNRTRLPAVSAFFERKGIWTCNSSRACTLGNDKAALYQACKEGNVSVPMADTRLFPAKELKNILYDPAYEALREKMPVIKSVHGHGGRQVFLLKAPAGYKKYFNTENASAAGHVDLKQYYSRIESAVDGERFILQEFLPGSEKAVDVRVYILANQIYAAVRRQGNKDFRANYSLGGNVEPFSLPEEAAELVGKILAFCPLEYGAIDMIPDKNNKWFLNEIEDMAGARMLYQSSDLDIAEDLASYLAGKFPVTKREA